MCITFARTHHLKTLTIAIAFVLALMLAHVLSGEPVTVSHPL